MEYSNPPGLRSLSTQMLGAICWEATTPHYVPGIVNGARIPIVATQTAKVDRPGCVRYSTTAAFD